jgi:hypothetical protein
LVLPEEAIDRAAVIEAHGQQQRYVWEHFWPAGEE